MNASEHPLPERIFLVGPMGSGKTTLGRRAASLLGMDFLDCDEEIETCTGASINLIFDIEGEAGFRERESRMLETLAERDNVIIATGGGAVLAKSNRDLMNRRGAVVWLKATVEQQLRRLELDRNRPLLQAPDRRERLQALAGQRDPLYGAIADLEFSPGGRSVARVSRELADAIRTRILETTTESRHAHH